MARKRTGDMGKEREGKMAGKRMGYMGRHARKEVRWVRHTANGGMAQLSKQASLAAP